MGGREGNKGDEGCCGVKALEKVSNYPKERKKNPSQMMRTEAKMKGENIQVLYKQEKVC